MKKVLLFTVAILIMDSFLLCSLYDYYKKGRITLIGVDDFGKSTNWTDYFYTPYNAVLNSTDGSLFVVSNRQNCIYKFDKNGNFVKKFGQKGRGPGDMISPSNPTIIDNKYLIVGERATNRRINIWDLNGNFVKLLRTKKSNFSTTALKKNKVAYFTYSQYAMKENGFKHKCQVIIKDTESGEEKIIRQITLLDRSWIQLGKHSSTKVGHFFGKIVINKTIEGNLVVGISDQPGISIYSPDGKLIRRFNLKINPICITGKYIEKFRDAVITDLKKAGEEKMNPTQEYYYNEKMKVFPKYDFSKVFSTHLPLYYQIEVDSEGNFLVFLYNDCLKNCKTHFQVYSKNGEFICETELDKGNYDFHFDRYLNICFTSDGIIWYAMEKDDEEEIYRLYKSKF